MKYALIGCGKVAVKHLRAALDQRRELEIAALVDTRPEAADSLIRSCKIPAAVRAKIRIYTDYQAMLDEIRPDLVAITTPSGSHFAVAGAAIAAGAHVLVEKPLTLSLAQADELLAQAASRGVRIAVGHIYRFFPIVQAIQADLQAGRLGRILQGEVIVRWGHAQSYYDQAAWRGTWAEDGGVLMNQSIHALDLMTWLLGSPVSRVSGWIGRQSHRMEAEDIGLAILELENGCCCQVSGTTSTDPQRQEARFTIIGSEGEIRCGILRGKPVLEIRDRQGHNLTRGYVARFLRETLRQGGLSALLRMKNPHSGLYGDLIRAIRETRAPLADGRSGRDAVELVLAIYQSAKLGHPVRLPIESFTLQDMRDYFPPFSS